MTATLLAADLARIIDAAAIFATRDTALPTINAVQLESSAKHLIAVATDRFTIGSSVADYNEGKGPSWAGMLRLPHAQLVSKVARSTKAAFTDVTITATATAFTFAFASGEKLALPKIEASIEFPDWRKLFESHTADDGSTQQFGVDSNYLARFARISGSRHMAIKFAGPNKPALVSIGSSFVGLIMPVRMSGDSPAALPEWLARPAPKKRAARAKKPAEKAVPA